MEDKNCKLCQAEFNVSDDDLNFLEKISPVFHGEKTTISSPSLCPECRINRRICWRNERHLYKRKCDLTGQSIVSVYSPDKPYKVYSNSAFQSDKWDPMSYGVDFDFSRGFFEQFGELLKQVPRQANNAIFNENCDFCNQTWHSKDSYMSFNLGYGERCFYNNEAFYVKDCVDVFDVRNCEFCYNLFDCGDCNSSTFLEHCKGCSECHFSYDCSGCQNIVMSTGIKNKQYYIRNKEYSKEEYLEKLKELEMNSRSGQKKLKEEFEQIKKSAIHKPNSNIKTENCTGDYIIESKDCQDCYNICKSEDCHRIGNIDAEGKDCRDMSYIAECELCYEGTSIAGYHNVLSFFVGYGQDNLYANFCDNCKNCFACVGLKRKEYCVFNKQYTQEEYETLVPKIIEKMKQDGEWGEGFPASLSTFAYNETVANDYYPKSKEEAEKFGSYWQDNNYESEFNGSAYEPLDKIDDYKENQEEIDRLLSGIIKCEKTGKPFKVLPQEVSFYIKNNIPTPIVHYSERFKELFRLRNPRKLFERQCDCEEAGHDHEVRCSNKFKTTYAPDRPGKVFCEECYQKKVL